MKIVDTTLKMVEFKKMHKGQVFIWDDTVFMATERLGSYNSARLTDGNLFGFDDTDLVTPIEAHLVITERGGLNEQL